MEKNPDEWLKYVNGSQVLNSALTMQRKRKRGSETGSVRDTNLSDYSNFSDSDYSNSDREENEEKTTSEKGSNKEQKMIKRVKT